MKLNPDYNKYDELGFSVNGGDYTDASGNTFEVDLDRTVATYTYSGSSTTHGESYDIEVAVCNSDGLCSTPIGTATVVADKEVEG